MAFIRSISGLRATLGDDLTPTIVAEYVAGFSASLSEGDIVVGSDGRPSYQWIEKIVAGTLAACGRKVIMTGVVPTPTVQMITEHDPKAVGGIIITASHNPSEWNGLKFIDSDGVFLDAEANAKLWEHTDNKDFKYIPEQKLAELIEMPEAGNRHIDAIINSPIFSKSDTIAKLKKLKLKIVVDAVNASGSIVVPALLRKLGCEVVELYCDASGIFPHTPEPLPINLTDLAAAVKEHKADLGIAVDPDADRLVLIDETGNPIGEELTITLAAEAALSSKDSLGEYDPVVTVNYSTTRAVEDIAAKYGATVQRSAVGEINVVKKMKEVNALIGGEGSGGVILPACHYGRDSLVGCALILHLLAQRGVSLSEICAELPKYEMLKLKQPFSGKLDKLIDEVIKAFPDGKATRDDGIKIDFEKSWVQLRASNTEPIVRIIAEAPTMQEVEELTGIVIGIVG